MRYGTVDGVEWTLTRVSGTDNGDGSPDERVELMLGADAAYGSMSVSERPLPGFPDDGVRMAYLHSGVCPSFVGYFGLVPAEAVHIVVEDAETGDRAFDVATGSFVFFAPRDLDNDVKVIDESGTEIARRSLVVIPAIGRDATAAGDLG